MAQAQHAQRAPHAALLVLAALPACYHHAVARGAGAGAQGPPPPSEAVGEMVEVPAGTFVMGDLNGEPDENPEHEVYVDRFAIDRTEATVAAYAACVEARVCDPPSFEQDASASAGRLPVVGVSWADADRFCRWVGKRLPTEAEWEHAARGDDARRWPTQGVFDESMANTAGKDSFPGLAPVGSFPSGASPYGALDMAGNAAEWVADGYDADTYARAPRDNPKGGANGRERVVRGGSFVANLYLVRATARRSKDANATENALGFRCAK